MEHQKLRMTITLGRGKNQAGVSLNEFILYSGLAAIAVATAIAGFRFAKSGGDGLRTQQELASIRANTISLYQSAPDFTGLTLDMLDNAKAKPDSIVKSGADFKNVYGGNVTLEPSAANAQEAVITYNGVPVEDCVRIMSAAGSGWLKFKGSTQEIDFITTPNPSVTVFTAACTTGATNGRTNVEFTFRK